MAVAYYEVFGESFGPRNFHPPKRADLKYWYKEAKKGISQLPLWQESFRSVAKVDEEVITFDIPLEGILTIARKRNLR